MSAFEMYIYTYANMYIHVYVDIASLFLYVIYLFFTVERFMCTCILSVHMYFRHADTYVGTPFSYSGTTSFFAGVGIDAKQEMLRLSPAFFKDDTPPKQPEAHRGTNTADTRLVRGRFSTSMSSLVVTGAESILNSGGMAGCLKFRAFAFAVIGAEDICIRRCRGPKGNVTEAGANAATECIRLEPVVPCTVQVRSFLCLLEDQENTPICRGRYQPPGLWVPTTELLVLLGIESNLFRRC